MTIIQPYQFDLLARNVVSAQRSLLTSVQRLGSGKRFERPSDGLSDWFAGLSLGAARSQVSQAIVNTRRADQVVSVAIDSVSQIRSLVGSLRSLVVESQNLGALSSSDFLSIESDVDLALESIDRIARSTTASGRRLLDGSAAYRTQVLPESGIRNVQVYRASTNNGVHDITIDVRAIAESAELTISPEVFRPLDSTADIAAPIEPIASPTNATVSFGRGNEQITVTATKPGPEFNDVRFQFRNRRSLGDRAPVAEYDADRRRVTVTYNSRAFWWNRTYASVANAIDRLAEFSAEVTEGNWWQAFQSPRGNVTTGNTGGEPPSDPPPSEPMPVATAGLQGELVLRVAGTLGTEVVTFNPETTLEDFAEAINQLTDRTGVRAEVGDELRLVADDAGAASFVELEVIREEEPGRFGELVQVLRANGTEADVLIDGQSARVDGNRIRFSSPRLDLAANLGGELGRFQVRVLGSGLQFQLGPEVIPSQQASVGIPSLFASRMMTEYGDLGALRSNIGLLRSDPSRAYRIVSSVERDLDTLLGKLSGFRSQTLGSNLRHLEGREENLLLAESSITDVDFAAEVARLTQSQLLAESGTRALQVAHQTSRLLLSLIQPIG